MLGDTSRLLSGLTDYAAVVIATSHHDPARIRSVQTGRAWPRRWCWSWSCSPTAPSRSGPWNSNADVTDLQVLRPPAPTWPAI